MDTNYIRDLLPFDHPYLFVDTITSVTQENIVGSYTFKKDEFFYKGHFKDNPVTPGTILTECCAQLALVCHGLFLSNANSDMVKSRLFFLASSEMDFYSVVLPNEKVIVTAEKIYFRFGKLKSKVKMTKEDGTLVCKGVLSGMQKNTEDG
ncbi:3-hydroxyacyl-ACP dehydratase FabZ family protein [Croceivirga lutea]|uniref:3-hydroxyacyl-ACP dehydratase FabZ family protein n=1 Tax=Croceivirga lutea TaxID=1775167 RepID=UPI001639B456|nr:hydroxymyristoyl-ACP dehydratase [Croceivirga lutea]